MDILVIVGVLTVVVNVITEVIKKLFSKFETINIFVVVLSLALTIISMVGYCQYKIIDISIYYWISSIIVGFIVSYSAMFGFDKAKQAIEQIKTYLNKTESEVD